MISSRFYQIHSRYIRDDGNVCWKRGLNPHMLVKYYAFFSKKHDGWMGPWLDFWISEFSVGEAQRFPTKECPVRWHPICHWCVAFAMQVLGRETSNILLFSPRYLLGRRWTQFWRPYFSKRGWFNHQLDNIRVMERLFWQVLTQFLGSQKYLLWNPMMAWKGMEGPPQNPRKVT